MPFSASHSLTRESRTLDQCLKEGIKAGLEYKQEGKYCGRERRGVAFLPGM
jgi:hypothetical protein